MKLAGCAIALCLASAVVALPTHGGESGVSLDSVATIEHRTNEELAALRSDGNEKAVMNRLQKAFRADNEVRTEANPSNVWYTSTEVSGQLKEAELEAKRLMAEKKNVLLEKSHDAAVISAVKNSQEALGEAFLKHAKHTENEARTNDAIKHEAQELAPAKHESLVQDALIKAAKWNEGEKLAAAVKDRKAISASVQDSIMETESKDVMAAVEAAKQIDQAGARLNKWYNAHEHTKQELYRHALLGESMTPEQQKIQDAAIASIKEIEARAAKAMDQAQAAKEAPEQSSTAREQARNGASTEHESKTKNHHPAGDTFVQMGEAVNKAMLGVKKEATKAEKDQMKLEHLIEG